MNSSRDQRILVATLVSASLLTYLVHFLLFHDTYSLFFYGIMDIAFIPISVLLVSLVINRVLVEREKQALLSKLDMVIGVFFSEVGMKLLRSLGRFDAEYTLYSADLIIDARWTAGRYVAEGQRMQTYPFGIDSRQGDLAALRDFLHEKRGFLMRLLENPNLLAHETFTELLLAITHVAEELDYRDDLLTLPTSDYAHLSGDMKRAYGLMIREWLTYMNHLRTSYPYLFSLAVRTNPFDASAVVEVP